MTSNPTTLRGRPSENPTNWTVFRHPNGTTGLRLPDNRIQWYSEEELAMLVVATIGQENPDPKVYEVVRILAGEDRWAEAVEVFGALTAEAEAIALADALGALL